MSGEDPGQLARAAARRELLERRIEAIDEIDVERIANFHRLFVVEGDLHGAEGRSVTGEGAGIIRIRNDIERIERRRFIIAHEIGHCILHKSGSVKPCSQGDLFRYEEGNREAEANWFASELLMPAVLFRPHCDVAEPSFAAVKAVARVFRTTLTATCIRFVQLSAERCALVWSESGRVKWCVRSADFPGWIERGRVLSGNSHAADVFSGRGLPIGFKPVPQMAWLDRHVLGGRSLMEETLAFDTLGAALSILWFPVERDEDDRADDDNDDDPRWRR
ncbi:MAG: ImmA/IrrE family metallo-endopeptidase [Deltaproteobacteria bacterium]|nr:ImmA/IrrE family metallo-endopeptidase [Deltaproteobacteria bacterium]